MFLIKSQPNSSLTGIGDITGNLNQPRTADAFHLALLYYHVQEDYIDSHVHPVDGRRAGIEQFHHKEFIQILVRE